MNIQVDKTAEDVCGRLAFFLSEMAIEGANVALSGGSTPKLLFHLMAEQYRDTDWSRINFFWVDERMVPQKDKESNFGEFYRILVSGGVVPETSLFPIRYHDEEHVVLSQTEAILRKKVPFANGFPRFDLIVLGIGEDGHTASIFPGNMQLFDTKNIVAATIHPQTGQHRITLTGNTINNAKRVLFLCTGISKRTILDQVIRAKKQELPATHVSPVGELTCYLDEAADINNQGV